VDEDPGAWRCPEHPAPIRVWLHNVAYRRNAGLRDLLARGAVGGAYTEKTQIVWHRPVVLLQTSVSGGGAVQHGRDAEHECP
jgi:hypothetical protein